MGTRRRRAAHAARRLAAAGRGEHQSAPYNSAPAGGTSSSLPPEPDGHRNDRTGEQPLELVEVYNASSRRSERRLPPLHLPDPKLQQLVTQPPAASLALVLEPGLSLRSLPGELPLPWLAELPATDAAAPNESLARAPVALSLLLPRARAWTAAACRRRRRRRRPPRRRRRRPPRHLPRRRRRAAAAAAAAAVAVRRGGPPPAATTTAAPATPPPPPPSPPPLPPPPPPPLPPPPRVELPAAVEAAALEAAVRGVHPMRPVPLPEPLDYNAAVRSSSTAPRRWSRTRR